MVLVINIKFFVVSGLASNDWRAAVNELPLEPYMTDIAGIRCEAYLRLEKLVIRPCRCGKLFNPVFRELVRFIHANEIVVTTDVVVQSPSVLTMHQVNLGSRRKHIAFVPFLPVGVIELIQLIAFRLQVPFELGKRPTHQNADIIRKIDRHSIHNSFHSPALGFQHLHFFRLNSAPHTLIVVCPRYQGCLPCQHQRLPATPRTAIKYPVSSGL